MDKTKILVVEDESVTVLESRTKQEDLSYAVPVAGFCSQKTFDTTETTQPDLVSIGIHLQETMDGLEAV